LLKNYLKHKQFPRLIWTLICIGLIIPSSKTYFSALSVYEEN